MAAYNRCGLPGSATKSEMEPGGGPPGVPETGSQVVPPSVLSKIPPPPCLSEVPARIGPPGTAGRITLNTNNLENSFRPRTDQLAPPSLVLSTLPEPPAKSVLGCCG